MEYIEPSFCVASAIMFCTCLLPESISAPDMCYEVGESARPVIISTYQVGCLQVSVMMQRHLLSGTYAQDSDTS